MIQVDSERARSSDPSRFQFTGGLLERSFYLERPADRLLPEALLAGEYCHILAPRQIGKTSLCFRTARELTQKGVRCALVDVTAAGTPSSAEEWYFGLVDEIARRLRMPDPLDVWQARPGVAPAQRFRDYVRALVEEKPDGPPVVVFLDEIEMVRLAPVDVDDFLLMLRSFHEERGQSPALRRLSFCLIGVTTPNDLIKNKSVTPFNVSRPIRVDDFTRAECDALGAGLEDLNASTSALLDAVYAWTDGHPYMTMRVCFELSRQRKARPGEEQAAVDTVVREQFLERPLEDTNLNYAARRFEDPKFERDGARLADKIQLYRRVLTHQDPTAHNESSVQMELRICGMIKDVDIGGGKRVLRPRNRIYEKALDAEWLRSKGERRFFSEAVWKWLDAGKDDAALLRGVVLENALAWAKTNPLSEDEQAFLDASQRLETHVLAAERTRITQEVVRVQSEQREADEELEKAREALARAAAEKEQMDAVREVLVEQQHKLATAMTKTKRWLWMALLGLVVVIVWGAVVASRTQGQQRALAAANEELVRVSADAQQQRQAADKARELAAQERVRAEKAERLAKEIQDKEDELHRRKDELSQLDELRTKAKQALDEANRRVKEANVYVERNRDLLDRATKAEARALTAEQDYQLCRAQRPFATPPPGTTKAPPTKTADQPNKHEDPYP
jgi:hypothetical protein